MRHIISLIGIFLLAACLGRSPDSTFYTLEAVQPGQPLSSRRLTAAVNRVIIPDYLDKPQIVLRASDGVELQISEYQRWGETLASLLQRVTADDLNLLLPQAQIKPQSFTAQTYQYYVTLEINRMDGTWNDKAVLDAWWSITDRQNRVLKRAKANLSAPLKKSYQEYVQVQSRLLAKLSEQIAEALLQIR